VASKISQPAIELKDLFVTLPSRAGPVEILRGVSLAIQEGEAVAVVGPSGSGKTTLMMVTTGLERASAGEVIVAGQELGGLDEDQLALLRARNVGIVFQSFHLVPSMTALENVALPLEFLGDGDPFGRAASALASVGLARREDHFPAQLSGGEQQRVAMARALAPDPKIILADEPTGNLDGRTGTQVMDLLFDLKARTGATLVLITHDLDLARRCGRVLHMNDGKIDDGGTRARPRRKLAAEV
jgi:putative ABC transport system ATP-binding protein